LRALLAVLLLSVSSLANSSDRFYGEIHGGFAGIQHSELSFRPIEAHVSVGGYVFDHLGFDLSIGTAVKEGKDDDFQLELVDLTTLSLRFDSPPTDSMQAFILIGISQFAINQTDPGGARQVTENFQGGTLSIGLRRNFENTPFSAVGLYRLHYVDQPIDIDSWAIGVRAAWR